jgi:hypothetical protein
VGAPWSSQDPLGGRSLIQSQGPTALRIMLGAQLRRLREARGITAGAAGSAIRASHAKISRMELGRVGFKERDVADLLTFYGITEAQEREAFLLLARRANVPGWWHQYSDIVPSWFEMYLGLEQASSVIRMYEPQFVPSLLQTRQVARTIIQLDYPSASADDIERRITLRITRQEIFILPNAPNLWAVIDEAALWRADGHSAMRAHSAFDRDGRAAQRHTPSDTDPFWCTRRGRWSVHDLAVFRTRPAGHRLP